MTSTELMKMEGLESNIDLVTHTFPLNSIPKSTEQSVTLPYKRRKFTHGGELKRSARTALPPYKDTSYDIVVHNPDLQSKLLQEPHALPSIGSPSLLSRRDSISFPLNLGISTVSICNYSLINYNN